jgi:hypothetical protein
MRRRSDDNLWLPLVTSVVLLMLVVASSNMSQRTLVVSSIAAEHSGGDGSQSCARAPNSGAAGTAIIDVIVRKANTSSYYDQSRFSSVVSQLIDTHAGTDHACRQAQSASSVRLLALQALSMRLQV